MLVDADGSFDVSGATAAAAAALVPPQTSGKKAAATTTKARPAPPQAKAGADGDADADVDASDVVLEDGGKAEADGEEPEDKTPPPLGNGGSTDKYVWNQVNSKQ